MTDTLERDTLFGEDIANQIDEDIKKDILDDTRIATFEEELALIKNEELCKLAKELLLKLPDYFFEVPASSTGKYHPKYACGEGGLVRHTKAAIRIAESLLRLEMYQPLTQCHDHIIIALMLHDGFKHGMPNEDGSYSEYTVAEHPELCYGWLASQNHQTLQEHLNFIATLVHTHMGQWNENPRKGYIFAPKPQTAYQMFVHLCDYLASRKFLELVPNEWTL